MTSPRSIQTNAIQKAKSRCGSIGREYRARAGDFPRRENESPLRFSYGRKQNRLSFHKRPEQAMSAKVFMPRFNYHAFIFFCKFFGSGQFAFLETLRFTEFHLFSHFKHCFTSAVADVNMNWLMIVAIEEKPEPSPFKNSWHVRDYFAGSNSPMCDRLKPMLPVPRRGRTFDTFLICFHRFALRSGVPQQIQSYCELLSFTGLHPTPPIVPNPQWRTIQGNEYIRSDVRLRIPFPLVKHFRGYSTPHPPDFGNAVGVHIGDILIGSVVRRGHLQ